MIGYRLAIGILALFCALSLRFSIHQTKMYSQLSDQEYSLQVEAFKAGCIEHGMASCRILIDQYDYENFNICRKGVDYLCNINSLNYGAGLKKLYGK